MSNVGSVSLLSPSSSTSTSSNSSSTLTQADFLKLMVAQFTQQDPLASSGSSGSGSGTSDYVNQLMSMTNLTTLQTVSSQQGVQLAQAMPGDNVTVTDSSGKSTTGTVEKTTLTTGSVSVTVNGVAYPTTEITSVNQTAAQAAAAKTSSTTSTP